MNKTKIVLLTILIVLVLYCGGVIFITKPDSGFSVLNGNKAAAPAASSETAAVDSDAILAQAEKIASEKADDARKSSEEYADKAIAEAIAKLVIPEALEGDTVIQKEEFDLDAHMPEIVDAVASELLKDKDAIIDMVVDALIERLDSSESSAADADYDTLRRQMREEEIRKIVEQLHD